MEIVEQDHNKASLSACHSCCSVAAIKQVRQPPARSPRSIASEFGGDDDVLPGPRIWAIHCFTGLMMALVLCLSTSCRADDDPGKTREEIQRELNAAVMASPFTPGDIKKAEAYAEQAKKDKVAPTPTPPSYWLPGWTCANLTSYAYYNYGDYQNCVYYHHYYGRYW